MPSILRHEVQPLVNIAGSNVNPSITPSTTRLVTRPPALGDDLGHLVHLSLRTAEGTEPLLRQLSRALVLAVAQKFDHTALVWGEAVGCALVIAVSEWNGRSVGGGDRAYPETSFTTSRTNAVLLLK